MAGREFFHQTGVSDLESLIALSYDLAWFWKVDPDQIQAKPLDLFLESLMQAQRIKDLLQVP